MIKYILKVDNKLLKKYIGKKLLKYISKLEK